MSEQQPNITITTHTIEGNPVDPATIVLTAEELAAVVQAGTQLLALIEKIKANQADAWQAVASDFQAAAAAFDAAASTHYNDANALPVGTAQAAPMGPPEGAIETTPGTVAGAQG